MAITDLPDWTIGQNLIIAQETNETIANGSQLVVDTSSSSGVTLNITTATTDASMIFPVYHRTAFDTDGPYVQQILTCIANPGDVGQISFETPSYANILVIPNVNGFDVDMNLLASGRTVTTPRFLNSTFTGTYYTDAEAYTNGTPVLLVGGNFGALFASNGSCGINAVANTDGVLCARFFLGSGSDIDLPIAALVAGTRLVTTVALPQGVIGFSFIPAADNPAGTLTLMAAPAQL